MFHVFAALAAFIREPIVQETNEALPADRVRGQRLGRPPAMIAEQIRQDRAILTQPEETVSSVARLLQVSRSTIYQYVPELGKDNELTAGDDRAFAPRKINRYGSTHQGGWR